MGLELLSRRLQLRIRERAVLGFPGIDDLAEPTPGADLPELPRLTAVCTPGITLPAGELPWRKLARRRLRRREALMLSKQTAPPAA